MKLFNKKYFKERTSIVFLIIGVVFLLGCDNKNMTGMANPWSDCNDNIKCAAKIAGFNFPLKLSNYSVRAMKDMIEITYPLDEFRDVIVRKSEFQQNNGDISGVYTQYPINKTVNLKNGVSVDIRADKNKIYVMNMVASTGYYSAYCKDGMSMNEIEGIYEVLREAEEPKFPPEAIDNSPYFDCELGDLVGDDVKRIKVKKYNVDYHSDDYTKEQVKKLAMECINEGVKSQYTMDCCMTHKMFPNEGK